MTILPLNIAADPSPEALTRFLAGCQAAAQRDGRPKLASISVSVPALDPLAVLESIFEPGELHFYAERPTAQFALAGAEAVVSCDAAGPERFRVVQGFIDATLADTIAVGAVDAPFAGPHFFTTFAFAPDAEPEAAFPAARVFVPRWQVARQGDVTTAVANLLVAPDAPLEALAERVWRAHRKFQHFDYATARSGNESGKESGTGVPPVGLDASGNRGAETRAGSPCHSQQASSAVASGTGVPPVGLDASGSRGAETRAGSPCHVQQPSSAAPSGTGVPPVGLDLSGRGNRSSRGSETRASSPCHSPEFPSDELASSARLRVVTKEVGDYRVAVSRGLSLIADGAFQKIVLARAQDLSADQPLNPLELLNGLRQRFPECFSFSVANGAGQSFIGASPERLARVEAGVLETEALAGSARRGASASDDAALGAALLRSEKDVREHRHVLGSIVRRLSPLGLQVEHPSEPVLRRLANVQHLLTPVRGRLPEGVRLLDALARLHPTPAVGGTPREQALPHIRELEGFPRGLYAGAVGWLDARGNGEFFVGLRSALVDGHAARLYAGAGIVAGSEPEKEFAETELKFRALRDALLA